MPRPRKSEEVITFKVDRELMGLLRNLPNRSEFIRLALLRAFEHVCPLCRGYGYLTPKQKEHWEELARSHSIAECPDCHELHLVCEHADDQP